MVAGLMPIGPKEQEGAFVSRLGFLELLQGLNLKQRHISLASATLGWGRIDRNPKGLSENFPLTFMMINTNICIIINNKFRGETTFPEVLYR